LQAVLQQATRRVSGASFPEGVSRGCCLIA
jgi:hypothetical protein